MIAPLMSWQSSGWPHVWHGVGLTAGEVALAARIEDAYRAIISV